MTSAILMQNSAEREQQILQARTQNFAAALGGIYTALAIEDYRHAVDKLKERQAAWDAANETEAGPLSDHNGGKRPDNLSINPAGIGEVAIAYARQFAFDVHPRSEMENIEMIRKRLREESQ